MAFIDRGEGNHMAYGCDSKGAYNAFSPSLGGCEAYVEEDICNDCKHKKEYRDQGRKYYLCDKFNSLVALYSDRKCEYYSRG